MKTDEERWLDHVGNAHARGDLTLNQLDSDIGDVLQGMKPRHFLATVEDKMPIYSDSLVPFQWVAVA